MRYIFLLALMFSSATLLSGQSGEDENLQKAIKAFLLAVKNNDAGATEKLLADNYMIYGGFICIKNKADRIACVKAGRIKYQLQDTATLKKKYRIYGNDADFEIRTVLKYSACGEDVKEQTVADSPVILHFVKQGNQWLISSECLGGSCLH